MTTEAYEIHEQDATTTVSLGAELAGRDMFCLHGIALDSVGRNSILPEATTLADRFRLAIEQAPVLSATVHTDAATTSKAPLWSTVGLIIRDGTIQAASPRDMSSVMLTGGSRRTPDQSPAVIMEALDHIASNDRKYPQLPPHNEVVVAQPVIAGLYFKDTSGLMRNQINTLHTTAAPNTVPELIRDIALESDLPIFAIRTSGVYEVKRHDLVTGAYEFANETAPRVHPAEVESRYESQLGAAAVAGVLAPR